MLPRYAAMASPAMWAQVHFIVAACENMIDGKGLRPGDVVTAASGKTIEVNNTDAEGRLTLADAVWFAQEKAGASTVVDVATLTGAAIVALGLDIAALFSSSEALSASLTQASRAAGASASRGGPSVGGASASVM
jgi:leucyl aminopeptidase